MPSAPLGKRLEFVYARAMRRVIAGLMLALPLATGMACSGAAPEPVTPPTTTASAAPTDTAPADVDAGTETDNGAFDASTLHPVEDAGSDASEAKGPSACADGMVLVEGDYCTDVEQKCLKSWFDKSNKKKVCEEF
ncbi:MAG: hypothetical protein R3B07_02890 [Polyangiaceae bacterium]